MARNPHLSADALCSARAGKTRPRKWLLVFELPPGRAEWMLGDLRDALKQSDGSTVELCFGVLRKASSPGTSWRRLANGMWVHFLAFLQVIFGRYDCVVVRTSPPLIQMTVAAACWLRRVPYVVWLMDAHPEIEAAICRTELLRPVLRALVRLNRRCLDRAQIVVVLDEAMRQTLVPGADDRRVVVCPTWPQEKVRMMPASRSRHEREGEALRLVYMGNFGLAHDEGLFGEFIATCARYGRVHLTFINTDERVVRTVRGRNYENHVEVTARPFLTVEQVRAFASDGAFDFGIVALGAAFGGLLSPSKFAGYFLLGVPIIYIGPPNTNTALVCDRFRAGIRLDAAEIGSASSRSIQNLWSGVLQSELKANLASAVEHFAVYDATYLARAISQRLDGALREAGA